MKTLWTVRYAILSLTLLTVGWLMLNIWVVMAGALLPIITIRHLTQAHVAAPLRAVLFFAILAMLTALALFSHNHDFALAAVIYGLCGGFTPWLCSSAIEK